MVLQDVAESTAPSPPVIGNCVHRVRSGWRFDENLLALWGVGESEASSVLLDPLLPIMVDAGVRTWDSLVGALGPEPCVVFYQLVDTEQAQVRQFQAVVRWDCDRGGDRRVLATHMDISRSVALTRVQERARAHATTDRVLALSRMGAAVASSAHPGELLHRITRLAAASVGGRAHLVVLGRDSTGYDWDIVAPQWAGPAAADPRVEPAVAARVIPAQTRADAQDTGGPQPDPQARPSASTWDALVGAARSGTLSRAEGRPIVAALLGLDERSFGRHLAVTLRTAGRVTGLLAVLRDVGSDPFDPADHGLLQVLADGAGAAVTQARARRLLDLRTEQLQHVTEEREELLGQRDDLLEQLDTAERRERMLVAEVVHDDPLQLIVAASLRLDALPPHPDAGAAQETERCIGLLEQASERLRALMTDGLTPPDLSAGLCRAVRAIAEVVFLGSRTTVHVTMTDEPATAIAESTAYRVAREALINARRHAGATTVTVDGTRCGDSLVVVIEDDGVGCDRHSSPEGHFGISVMHARAEAAGGTLSVSRRAEGGCQVRLELPEAFTDRA